MATRPTLSDSRLSATPAGNRIWTLPTTFRASSAIAPTSPASRSVPSTLRLCSGGRRAARGLPLATSRAQEQNSGTLIGLDAAGRRGSAPGQDLLAWPASSRHPSPGSGRRSADSLESGTAMHASHALYTSRWTGPTPQAHSCTRCESGFFSIQPQPWHTWDSRSRAGSCRACAPAFAALRVRTLTNPAGPASPTERP